MPPLAALILNEIERGGPMPFRRFMELALYHPEHGYYRHARDPFGKGGDFYTAEQLQPTFGLLIAARIRRLFEELGRPPDFTVVELGAGRGEMAQAFSEWRYVPVDIGRGSLPERFTGVVFSNEFFDALPVDVAILRGGAWREMQVGWNGERFMWIEDGVVPDPMTRYIETHLPGHNEGNIVEINLEALSWMERIAASIERGFVLTIDYGYTSRESTRFPQGTLMAYHRHIAREDVLAAPGERDITAHVCFTALEEHGRSCGLETVRLEPLSQTLLAAGEDAMAAAASGSGRLQLQTLLFSMGETFRTLLQRRI